MKRSSNVSWVALGICHVAGLAAIALTAQWLMGTSISSMRRDQHLFLLAVAAAFAVAAGFNLWSLRRRFERWQFAGMLLVAVAAFGVAALGLLLVQAPYVSRPTLVASIALTMIVLTMARVMRTAWLMISSVALLLVGTGMLAGDPVPSTLMHRVAGIAPKPSHTVSVLETWYGPVSATYYDSYFPICDATTGTCDYTPRTGGGVDALADGYLVGTGEGALHYVTRDSLGTLNVSRLPYTVPLNDGEFAASGASPYARNVFRVTDLLVEELAGETTIYASHPVYDKAVDCVAWRVSALRGPAAHLSDGTVRQRWDTVYQTKPCLRRATGPNSNMPFGQPYPLQQSGGRLARLDASTLLWTVGDHNLDGVNADTMVSQDLTADYGKTLAINVESGSATVFTSGHRNPQGLYVAESGDIWLTEQGPQGGDELNRLVRGTNYGWPLVTYGSPYGPTNEIWPLSVAQQDHRGFEEPVYSWAPSIAASSVIALRKNRFPYWQGDLLIGSLRESLLRARIRSGRVVMFERVPLRTWRGRIRDLFEDRHGNIVVWFDDGVLAFLEPAASMPYATPQNDGVRGQALFNACAGCHTLTDGLTHGIGPDLAGVVNRPIAARNGYMYSPDLAQVSGSWTEENLDRFLADPQAFAPGNTMLFTGLSDPKDRGRLIEYLKESRVRPADR
jgi:cytochrome c2